MATIMASRVGRWRAILPLVVLLAATSVQAAPNDLIEVELWDDVALSNGGTLTSKPLSGHSADPEMLLLTVTSALGTANVKVEYTIAQDGAGTFGTTAATDDLTASTATEFSGAPEERIILLLPSAPQFQLVVTELGGNTDTRVSAIAIFRSR